LPGVAEPLGVALAPDLYELVAAQAARTPEAVALVHGRERLTYRDLSLRAGRLARRLAALGVGPEVRVGVCLARTPALVTTLLGILGAGGAYVPLDPNYPRERLGFMLEDAGAAVIVTERALASRLPASGARLLVLDEELEAGPAKEAAEAEPSRALPANLAYLIYTSGSTGKPKAVAIEHRSAVAFVRWAQGAFSAEELAAVLASTSISFDLSVFELFVPLSRGGRVILAANALELPDLPAAGEVTLINTVPSAMAELVRSGALPPGVRTVNLAGEPLKRSLAQAVYARGVDRVLNLYGPSEDTTYSTFEVVERGSRSEPAIGRPLPGTWVRLLGSDLTPAPAGETGEICLGGEGLARGYLGRPELTAERFVPDPTTGPAPGVRVYRTGDLGRSLPDGRIEYLGRIDRQVKIRGFRVELGEIEAALETHPQVREAVVVAHEAATGDKRLVAYLVTAGEGGPSGAELRAVLGARLPDYMVPSSFVEIPALPLTPNGKVDRKELTRREPPRESAAGPAPLRTPTEELLAGIWREVLGVAISAEADFFDLGGHSLLIGQMLARVRSAFGVDLPLRTAFEARTLGALARRIEEGLRTDLSSRPPLVHVSREEPLPLSFAQRRLWFLDRLEPGSPVYNLPVELRLLGRLDMGALEHGLNEVFRRHEALRTTFAEGADGEPRQIVAPFHPFALPQVDLAGLPREAADRLAAWEARQPFDLVRGPVARCLLLRLGEEEHHLLFLCHHIAFDGWSVVVLQRELGALYGAFAAGRPSPLPELAFQYGDFAVWQRRWLTDEVVAAQLAYWRERLAGAPAALELPVDRPRPPVRSFRGATVALAFPAGLRDLARSEGSTLFMTVLAAFSALLGRFTGQTDLVVGSPVAGRTEEGIEDLLGFFVNTLALRADLAGDPSFQVLLGRVRESALAAYAHQDLPFERLVEELQPERDLSLSPLFQVILAFDPARGGELAAGLRCELPWIDNGTAKFDLSLYLQEQGSGLTGVLEYATDLFDPATAARLGGSLLRLLSGLLETGPAARVSELPLLGAAERWQLLGEWHEPRWWAPEPACLHELVAAQIARTPAAVALVYGRERITYRELGSRAGRLARRLAALGVGPEVRVGVHLSRTPALIEALLGILEAGGAYVPLDPSYPVERLGFMLEDASAAVIVTEKALAGRAPASRARRVVIDEEPEAMAEPRRALPGNLAYLIYTSGSTGRPKAVAIEHHSAVDLIRWAQGTFDPDELTGGVLASTSISFDVSVAELFVTLASGGRLILADNVLALPELPAADEVTLVCAVPSAIAALADARALPAGVKTVNLGGEPVKGALAAALYANGVERVRNLYGPSEDTTYSTSEVIAREEEREPTIGRPVAGGWVRLLDREMRPVPMGVLGEIHLGGAGLARGYLGRPELTAERYLPDPLSAEPGARLYRTSDLARYLPDGRLEYLGRIDHQVKVRGFRVELGEIEAVLSTHPQVREAAVVAHDAGPGDKRLVAYLAGEGPPSGDELRSFLAARLPDYMVPPYFVALPALPLSPNGKVDRRELARREPPRESAAEPAAALRTPAEELLAGIWAEVLGGAEAAAGDDFFDLGGHSLLIGQVLARVSAAFGVDLPMRAAFEARSLGALARRIEEGLQAALPQRLPLARISRAEPPPLSFAQQRLWFLHRLDPGSAVYNLPVAFRLAGPLDADALERGLDEVFRRHEALRTTFAEGPDGEPRQAVAPFRPAGLPRIDLAALPPAAARAAAERLAAAEARRPFDLVHGPVARALLLRLGEEEHHLLFFCHHVAFDGWSVVVLQRELGALYGAFAAGRPSPLPELAFQYADFAVWQRRWLTAEAVAAQLAYWRERLAGAPAFLELPADRSRPPVQSFRGATRALPFPPGVEEGLRGLARSTGSTLFMTSLAAFSALLGRFTGQTDLVVGSPVAGRTEAGIEGLLGFFVNALALRADLAGDPSFRALLGRVRESALAAYAHQDLPFERLVEELQPERDQSRGPLFQVVLALDPTRGGELVPGLRCELLRVDTATAKYDLTLFLQEEEGGLAAVLEYATDLFDATTVSRFGGAFFRLLSGLLEAGPETRVSELPLLGAAERWQLLGEWHQPRWWAPEPACLHELVAAQIARTPEAVALVYGRERISYRELGSRAGRLARRLAALGVGPEVRVGVYLSRTPALIEALLGILEAGGAYVPLDPNYPAERLGFMLDDASAAVIVTEQALAGRAPASRARTVVIDEEPEGMAEPRRALPGNLAYLIYTSGSTGRPKAVAIEHHSAVDLVRWAQGTYDREELEGGVLASTSISFDVSVAELFFTLASGGRLILADNVLALPELPAADEVTLVCAVPSAIAAMAAARALPPGVKTVNLGGEPVKGALAEALYAGGVERVRNLYGPSEDTTYSTFEVIARGGRREPTIGRPVGGGWARLLDGELRSVPIGVTGEIYLGGAGLARGYLGRPELTAERYVPDPLASGPGERLYRTSDLGRYLPDGRLEYLGRLDHQVKVRGYRVELGEIEAALIAFPGVREAVVVALDEPEGDRSLAAYFVAAGEPVPTAGELRAHLRSRLIEPMVPASFTRLERLPLSPNGKVDRKALPAPESAGGAPGGPAGPVAPRGPADPLQELLAGIWAEVLERAELPGVDENFFELGGHSLLATRVIAQVRMALGIELPLRELFASPTVAELAAAVSEQQAEQRGGAASPAEPIEPLADRSAFPLSFAQQRLWFLDRLDPGSPVYNLPAAFRLLGLLDIAALEQGLDEVFRRHEILRTTFVEGADGEPRQVVAPFRPAGLPRVDLAALPAAAARAEAGRLAAQEARRPFDLAHGPLARTLLLRLEGREHHLFFFCHHIVFDGWSVGVLQHELGTLYGAFIAGRPSPLPEPAFQYGDFAAWQRRRLSGEVVAAQLAYWRQRLGGAPEALELPADRPRPPAQSFRGALLALGFPPGLAAGLRALTRGESSTLFITAFAAFAALLGRFTGQRDLVVGTPVAGRTAAGIEDLLGFFVNTLALRTDLAGDPSFRVLLGQVRESALSAYAHQDLPFERLVEELRPERELSRNPLVQVVFSLDPVEGGELAPGLEQEPLRVTTRTAKFDLTLFLEQEGGGLTAVLEYATDLFDATTMTRLGRSYLRLLECLVAAGAGAQVAELPLLGPAERWQILGEWNEPRTPPVEQTCLHDLVAAQVARTPEAVALVYGHERITYRDLAARAGRLAHRLAARGVGPEARVGVYLSRTPALVVTLLGILEAGGAYVPLDPSYPEERLAFMLEDAGAAVIVTERALASRLPDLRSRMLVLDEEPEEAVNVVGEAEPRRPCSRNLAYLIYTSGSTGRPKAVAIEHRSPVALVRWAQGELDPAELTGVLASTSISFDVSVAELFVTLASGGRLILADNVLALPDLPAAAEVTLVSAVPSAIAAMAAARALPPGVKTVNLGGEPVQGALAAALYAGGVERVRNLYGPSEDTTYSTCELIARGDKREPTIGRPVGGSRAVLLDAELRLVPVGVLGEIYLGGAGLARGYLGRPELTAERYVPDPLATVPGERLYRTSDLGRTLPDGRIEYLGRLDHQVKVRGYRIELGEIEAALLAHPQVRATVVVALGESAGDRSLAAYFVTADEPAPTAGELRDHLRGRLAEPMIPSSFTRLERLPLNPNGKVDRKALPAPEIEGMESGALAAPRALSGPLEELLAGIWAEVLERGELPGAGDDFFELGGHSLLAIRVVSRVREALGIELPLRALFAAPTLAELAAAVAEQQGTAEDPTASAASAPITPLADRSDLPLSFAQQRLWLLDRLEPGSTVYNLPLAYRIDGRLDAVALERAFGEVLRRHEVLRTTFAAVEASGEPRLVVAPSHPFPLPRIDLSGLPAAAGEAEAGRLADAEAGRPFDLAAGPLVRALLLVTGIAGQHLLVTMHHIASDGWSVDVLLGELAALYRAFAAGLPSPLPELPIQYADFAAWQRRWLAGPVLESQLAYWRRQLAGAPEALDLPTDRPRPAVETSRGTHFSTPLPAALAAGIRTLSRGREATLFMTLLAGFAAQLHRMTGATDVLLGSPVANRNRAEIEGLLGFFVNTLVMRVDLAGDPSFGTLIDRVRETALAAYAHQDVPFERLVEELAPQRSLARSPLVQVSFVLGVEARVHELAPGLPLVPLPVGYETSKFDLTLALDLLDDALVADLEFRTDLLDRTTVARWVDHFAQLLAAAVAHPEAPVSTFDLLSPAERHQLAREWNDTAAAPASPLCLHQLFEAQAARTPEAVALVSPDGRRRLSYRELEAAAEALARRLRALGIGPEVLAGVLVDRTVELVVALLAVLKAGGAYVPIDPAYPRQRVATLLASSGAAVLLTRRGLLADFAGSLPAAAVPVFVDESDEPRGAIAGLPPQPGNLAYVIYTSGSTGEPKGVAIEHRSAVAFARWAREAYTPEERAGVLGSTSICFDISIMEIFVTLAWGGRILLAENALALPMLPARGEVTMINAVPSAMAELVRTDRLPDSIRVVNTGGEAVKGALARRIYEQSRAARVVDVYGPSEDTTYSTTSEIPRDVDTPAVGRPIRGTRAWVLDADLRPVPIGIPGAVYIAGDGLARGYLRRPALTAERFLPDPHGEPGARLYRVGDLARWRVDGELEYLGRIDHQVKVRGFRIELGEIEAVLAAHPAIERAVVATHDYGKSSGSEDVRLVAWVVPTAAVEAAELLAWVGERLPEYMVPAAVVPLAALPLTPNGKVDRFALPIPAAPEGASAEAPRTPLEELVAGLWTEVLGGGRVGLHDDFFALGGYSLLAIRLLARLRAVSGVDLPLRALFAHPTVAALAAEVERGLRAPGAAALPPIEPAAAGGDAPASSAQERLWFFHQLDPGGSVLNVPHPLRLTGPLQPAALAAALIEIARRHAALRTSFAYGEGGLRQRIAPAAEVPLPLTDLGALPPSQREMEALRLMEEEAQRPFDLATGPLWRSRLLRLDAEDHRLLLTFHHTISDGWSTDVLNRDLAALYPAAAAGAASPLPEPTLQYADFAAWQRRWLDVDALAPQLAYWRRQLAGMPPPLDLPADRPRPARQSFRGAVRFLPLPPDLAAGVRELGRREGSTLFMTALAAFAALIGCYTGRTDVVVGSPAANRHQPGTEGLFGFFVGNLVLRLDLTGDPTFRELLRRAREAALGAYTHPDVPFERLVEELDPARDRSRGSLVQVMLSVQAAAGGPFHFAGLAAEPVEVHTATSQFDFTLFADDGPQGLLLAAEYSTDLFDDATAERMLAHVAALLAAVVANPELRLSALPADIAPRPRQAEAPAVEEPPAAAAESDVARRQALLAERRARLAGAGKELLESRLRRGK
jgi:amino acid adenylation domain-containing protein